MISDLKCGLALNEKGANLSVDPSLQNNHILQLLYIFSFLRLF